MPNDPISRTELAEKFNRLTRDMDAVWRERLLDRGVVAIDLRFKDRLVVRTTARPKAVGMKSKERRRKRPIRPSKDT